MNTTEPSVGACINRIFHDHFPFKMVKVEYEEKELRREIAFAIRNIYDVCVGLLTMDEAFRQIVKSRIDD